MSFGDVVGVYTLHERKRLVLFMSTCPSTKRKLCYSRFGVAGLLASAMLVG